MKKLISLFKIRREERPAAAVALLTLLCLHAFVIRHSFKLFSATGQGRWNVFIKNFDISGFDPITYAIVTSWDTSYNVYRHPFLAFMVWPLTQIDEWLTSLTGMNLVQFIVAVPLLFCAFYTFIFMFRILKDIVKISKTDALALSAMMFSFAYVMISSVVPDHFCVSMFLLVFTLYIAGMKMERGSVFKIWQTLLLFLLTAGVTLSNGIKIFIYSLFTDGRKFFRIRNLLFAVLIPAAFIWCFARWEYRKFVWPDEMARSVSKAKADSISKKKAFIAFADTSSIKDSFMLKKAFKAEVNRKAKAKYREDHKKPWNQHTGKPMSKDGFLKWTDVSTSRAETAVENLFGESIQLHDRNLLEDTLKSRPVIVAYSWIANYVAEAVIVLLFLGGIWCGRRSRFMWMALSGFAFDMILHLVLGFGINEVYIMGAHWLFVLPVAMAFLVKKNESRRTAAWLRSLIILLTVGLWIYNGTLFIGYLL